MSGFEIAGIVLGGFPIILEASRANEGRCQKWIRYRPKFKAFILDIGEQQMHYERIIVALLDEYCSDSSLAHRGLIADTAGTAWMQDSKSLLGYLGYQYVRFFECLRSIGIVIEQLRDVLGIDDECKVRMQTHVRNDNALTDQHLRDYGSRRAAW